MRLLVLAATACLAGSAAAAERHDFRVISESSYQSVFLDVANLRAAGDGVVMAPVLTVSPGDRIDGPVRWVDQLDEVAVDCLWRTTRTVIRRSRPAGKGAFAAEPVPAYRAAERFASEDRTRALVRLACDPSTAASLAAHVTIEQASRATRTRIGNAIVHPPPFRGVRPGGTLGAGEQFTAPYRRPDGRGAVYLNWSTRAAQGDLRAFYTLWILPDPGASRPAGYYRAIQVDCARRDSIWYKREVAWLGWPTERAFTDLADLGFSQPVGDSAVGAALMAAACADGPGPVIGGIEAVVADAVHSRSTAPNP